MTANFDGFSPKAFTFFRQLEKNNKREWFQPRKELFEQVVRAPMIELVTLLCEDVRKCAADHVVEPSKAIYRIYRDTRFSKDKTPYKTHVGAIFPPKGLGRNAGAGFYVGISPKTVEIAGGMYMPGPDELTAVRRAIAEDPKGFAKLVENKSLTAKVGPLLGAQLSRVPKGFDADHPAAGYLRMKQWYFGTALPAEAAMKPTIRKEVASRFVAMAPVVHWLNAAALRARREEEGAVDAIPRRPEPMF